MKQINYGKIVGEDGFDYLVTGCVERLDMLPQQVPIDTRYYVGAEVPRSIYRYDGATWINEGTKYYDTPEGSDQLDIYKFEMDINENVEQNSSQTSPGFGWGKEIIIENAENRGEPVKMFGYLKYSISRSTDSNEEVCISNFIIAEGQSEENTKAKMFGGTNFISYSNALQESTTFIFLIGNTDVQNNQNNFNYGFLMFLCQDKYAANHRLKLLNLDLTILYKK